MFVSRGILGPTRLEQDDLRIDLGASCGNGGYRRCSGELEQCGWSGRIATRWSVYTAGCSQGADPS